MVGAHTVRNVYYIRHQIYDFLLVGPFFFCFLFFFPFVCISCVERGFQPRQMAYSVCSYKSTRKCSIAQKIDKKKQTESDRHQQEPEVQRPESFFISSIVLANKSSQFISKREIDGKKFGAPFRILWWRLVLLVLRLTIVSLPSMHTIGHFYREKLIISFSLQFMDVDRNRIITWGAFLLLLYIFPIFFYYIGDWLKWRWFCIFANFNIIFVSFVFRWQRFARACRMLNTCNYLRIIFFRSSFNFIVAA